uniref:Protein with signal anchor n=1 Tax=Anopheles dirus TaxID=7168 RepID=A0A182N146_9DIPT
MLREKLAKVSSAMQQGVGWFKSGGIVSPMLLIYVLHMLWPDFRPFSVLFVVAIGFLWDRPVTEQRPSIKTSPLGDICAQVWALRTTRPVGMVVGAVAGVLTSLYLACYVLPLWLSLTMAALLVFWDRYQFGVAGSFSASPSLRDTITEQEIEEFVPELTEVSRVLLQEVGEQGADTTSPPDGHGDGPAEPAVSQNTAEEDEELYLNTLAPVATGTEFESAELSGSSSDELFCPEGPVVRKASGRAAHAKHAGEKPIEFKSSHFNANSSSDSDDNMSRGLCFNDDDMDGDVSRRPRQQPQQQQPDLATMMMMSASSLASNVLVDTVYKRLLDAGTLHQQQQQQQQQQHPSILPSVGFEQRVAPGSTIQPRRPEPLPLDVPEEDDESTDADEDSDFEMLNSEELNNL